MQINGGKMYHSFFDIILHITHNISQIQGCYKTKSFIVSESRSYVTKLTTDGLGSPNFTTLHP